MDAFVKPIANPCVVLRNEFEDWAVLINRDSAHAVGINHVGVVVWKLMDGQHSLDEIVAEAGRHFVDPPDTACKQISAFIETLTERGFVECEHASAGD